jgi:hypothetical protein
LGSVAVEIVIALIVIAKFPLAVPLALSVTVMLMLNVPNWVGVPESAPPADSVMPGGREPAVQV